MKKLLLFSLLVIISSIGIKAQKPITVSEDSLKVGNNKLPGISVVIPEVDYEKTLKNWIKAQESGTKSKVVIEGSAMSIFGAIVKNVSETPVNIYSSLMDRDSVLNLVVTYEMKKDEYISKATGESDYARARSYLFDFAKEQYIDLVNEQVKVEENRLKDLEKELGSLEKDQTGMEKGIRSSNRLITSEQDKLIVVNNELTSVTAAIIEHNKQLDEMEPGDTKDEKAKFIKDLERQKKRILKSIKKSENRISKADKSIDNSNRAIPRNDDTQERTRRRISDQEAVLQKFVDKLNKVKSFK